MEYSAARRLLLGLPHAPPLDRGGKPIMGRREAQRMGKQVHARVLAMFNAAETGRQEASARQCQEDLGGGGGGGGGAPEEAQEAGVDWEIERYANPRRERAVTAS